MALMNKMRQSMKTILLILVLAFVATIIFDWGMGGFRSKRPQGVIAQVNGSDITYKEFDQAYQQELKNQREQSGSEPSGYQIQQIENQVFERLVQQRLLGEIVNDLNLIPTDEEVGEELWTNPPPLIRDTPAFQDSNGVFDMRRYQAALDDPQLDQQWESVIFYLRNTLPFQKLGTLLNASVVVTDDDALIEYMKTNTKIKVDYLFFNSAEYNDAVGEPNDDEILAYYNEHQEEYKQNEQRVLDYIVLPLKASKADSNAVFSQAEDLIEDASSGQDFAELAEIYSTDPGSAENGGDLGYFNRDAMVEPFSDAAFAADEGEIVGPVLTQYGLHIIKVEDKRIQNDEEEVKARHILLKIEPTNSTRDAVRDEALYLSEYAQETDLRSVAEKDSVTVNTTQPFEEQGFIPGLGMEQRINRFAFRSQVGDVSGIIYTDRGYIVAQLTEIIPEQVQSLEDVKSRIINILKTEKRMELAEQAAQAAYGKLASGTPIDEVAQQDSLELQQTEEFTPGGTIPGIGREPGLAGKALGLNIGDYSEPIKGSRGYYLLQVVDKSEFDQEDFQAKKENLKTQLAVRQRNQIFGLWYQKVKEEADIEDFRSDFF